MTFRLFTNDTLKEKKNRENILCKLKTIKAPLRWALTAKKNHIYEFEPIYFSLRDIHFLDFTVMIKQKKSCRQISKSKQIKKIPIITTQIYFMLALLKITQNHVH